jgi:hypothetical protein
MAVAKHLEQARQQGRIGQVAIDPILPVKAFMDPEPTKPKPFALPGEIALKFARA